MRTGSHVARRGRRSVLTFGAALVMALGLAGSGLVTSATLAASGPASTEDLAAASGEGCASPSHPVKCRGDAASTPGAAVGSSSASTGSSNDRDGSTTARGTKGTGDANQVEPAPADLEVTKTSDATGVLDEGDPITYTITVTNVGETAAEDVELHDELPPGMAPPALGPSLKGELCIPTSSVIAGGVPHAALQCGPVSLDPGESASVEFEASTRGLCGTFVNKVDVEASNEPAELVGADNHARSTDQVEACHPSLSLDVTTSPTEGAVGTSIVYTYTVTNTGDTTLYSMTVRDELGTLGIIDGFSLRPGETDRFTATATLGTSPITNVATAVGEDVSGQRVTAQDSVTVAVVSAGGGGDGGDTGGAGGTPFTGAGTAGIGALALLLSGLGGVLVALTGRRSKPD